MKYRSGSLDSQSGITFKVYTEVTYSVLCIGHVSRESNLILTSTASKLTPTTDTKPSVAEPTKLGSDSTAKYISFNPEDLIGHSFLMDAQVEGTRLQARIVECIEEFEGQLELEREAEYIKFKYKVSDVRY